MSSSEQETKSYCLAAFAIEDRVDFRLVDHVHSELSAKIEDPIISFSASIVPGKRAQSDYFGQIYLHVRAALEQLVRDTSALVKHEGRKSIFDRIDAVVISTAGVVDANQTILQLPLFNWQTEKRIAWNFKGQRIIGFDLVQIISEIARDLVPRTDIASLKKKIFVVNDATACAAAEYNNRRRNGSLEAHDFAFVKVHNGINVGVVEEELAFTKSSHTEMGHFYPNYHPVDAANGFMGTCYFHKNCLEGMISLASITERARPPDSDCHAIAEWSSILDNLEAEAQAVGHQLSETALFKKLFRNSESVRGDGADLALDVAAHYITQLIHPVVLSPLLPSQIVIGGRFATDEVIQRVRDKLWEMTRGYPARPAIATREILKTYIQKSVAENARYIELTGALEIARGRAIERVFVASTRATGRSKAPVTVAMPTQPVGTAHSNVIHLSDRRPSGRTQIS